MALLRVNLQRSPRALIFGDQTIPVGSTGAAGASVEAEGNGMGDQGADRSNSTAASSSGPRSVASVISGSKKTVTPLSQSNAVPLLAGATHDVVTPEELGLGGLSEEEFAGLKQALINTADQVTELQAMQRQSMHELQEVAIELAAAAASFLVGYAINNDMFAIDDLIQKALQQLDADQPVRVRLNPADHELLKTLMNDTETQQILSSVSCVVDASIQRGGCRVESARKILTTDLHSRLEDIRRAWMEKLDDSQVERRGDGSTARTLRRFPDRRETA